MSGLCMKIVSSLTYASYISHCHRCILFPDRPMAVNKASMGRYRCISDNLCIPSPKWQSEYQVLILPLWGWHLLMCEGDIESYKQETGWSTQTALRKHLTHTQHIVLVKHHQEAVIRSQGFKETSIPLQDGCCNMWKVTYVYSHLIYYTPHIYIKQVTGNTGLLGNLPVNCGAWKDGTGV